MAAAALRKVQPQRTPALLLGQQVAVHVPVRASFAAPQAGPEAKRASRCPDRRWRSREHRGHREWPDEWKTTLHSTYTACEREPVRMGTWGAARVGRGAGKKGRAGVWVRPGSGLCLRHISGRERAERTARPSGGGGQRQAAQWKTKLMPSQAIRGGCRRPSGRRRSPHRHCRRHRVRASLVGWCNCSRSGINPGACPLLPIPVASLRWNTILRLPSV